MQHSPVPATPFAERFRTVAARRTISISLTLLIEGLLLLLLLSLGAETQPGRKEEAITVVSLDADEVSDDVPEPESPEPRNAEPRNAERAEPAEERPVPQQPAQEEPPPRQSAEPLRPQTAEPLPVQPAEPRILPTPPVIIPTPQARQPSAALPAPVRPAPSGRPLYGPPDRGGPPSTDTARVGTAPNGEPLYAAAWYREPREDEMRGYLSTASGPGWGLIACRTAPGYRVEDCVGLDEYPEGSRINRAALAAAWVFQVMPPRLGGQPLVGSWVRIRIDYGTKRR